METEKVNNKEIAEHIINNEGLELIEIQVHHYELNLMIKEQVEAIFLNDNLF